MSLNIYNPTTQQLTEVAGLDVKDSLEKVATLPTPTADYLNQVYILVGTQEGYHVGSIYQCRYINSAYTWVEITGSVVGKADKAPNATNNHLAKLTADGNLADSGIAVGDLGTAINKNWTDLVRPNSHDLVESNAVYSAITNAISSIYTPHGDITCAELVPALLIEENIGNVYTVTDSGTTTAYFMQGAGKTINVGDSVSIIKAGATEILFNLMGNVLDLTDYQKKNLSTAIEGATTVEGALGALSTNKATQAEVNDIVNVLGAKNLIPYPYYHSSHTENGITFTVNNDGSVKVSGTATADTVFRLLYQSNALSSYVGKKIIISGCPQGGGDNPFIYFLNFWGFNNGVSLRDTGDGATGIFTPSGGYGINIQVGNGVTIDNTFYPMVRLASDPDDTYVPYAPTNAKLNEEKMSYADNEVLGVKNLLNHQLESQTITQGGANLTVTVNADKSVLINGTSGTTQINLMLLDSTVASQKALIKDIVDYGRKIKITGCPQGGSSTGYRIGWWLYNGSDSLRDYGKNASESFINVGLPTNYTTGNIAINIAPNQTVNNVLFKPMITFADDSTSDYDHYVPYAMTNQRITPYVQAISNPNLFDNPWFTVNQREITNDWTTQFSLGVDRWRKSSLSTDTIQVTANGIKEVNNKAFSFYQVLDSNAVNFEHIKQLYGKNLTFSILFSDGQIETGTIFLPSTDYRPSTTITHQFISNSSRLGYAQIESFTGSTNIAIRVLAGSYTVRAVKLEVGTVSTLKYDVAPNYIEELQKCKAFFERNSWFGWTPLECTTAGQLRIGLDYKFDVAKIKVPTFTFKTDNNNGLLYDLTSNTTIPSSEIVISNSGSYNKRMIELNFAHNSIVVGHKYRVSIGDDVFDAYAEI